MFDNPLFAAMRPQEYDDYEEALMNLNEDSEESIEEVQEIEDEK